MPAKQELNLLAALVAVNGGKADYNAMAAILDVTYDTVEGRMRGIKRDAKAMLAEAIAAGRVDDSGKVVGGVKRTPNNGVGRGRSAAAAAGAAAGASGGESGSAGGSGRKRGAGESPAGEETPSKKERGGKREHEGDARGDASLLGQLGTYRRQEYDDEGDAGHTL